MSACMLNPVPQTGNKKKSAIRLAEQNTTLNRAIETYLLDLKCSIRLC